MQNSQSSFRSVSPPGSAGPIRERNSRLLGICASLRGEELSGSLLGTWAHFSNGSSRSRLCRPWLRNAGSTPVGGTFGGQETCDEFLKFQLSPAPATLPHSRTKLQCPAVARESLPVMTGRWSRRLHNHGLEGRAAVFWPIAWKSLYPILNQ